MGQVRSAQVSATPDLIMSAPPDVSLNLVLVMDGLGNMTKQEKRELPQDYQEHKSEKSASSPRIFRNIKSGKGLLFSQP